MATLVIFGLVSFDLVLYGIWLLAMAILVIFGLVWFALVLYPTVCGYYLDVLECKISSF